MGKVLETMNTELNDKMAEVMGWEKDDYNVWWIDPNRPSEWNMNQMIGIEYWKPSENVDQALMAVDKIGLDFYAERSSTDKKYWVIIGGEIEDPNVGESESLAEAICLAVSEACDKLKGIDLENE